MPRLNLKHVAQQEKNVEIVGEDAEELDPETYEILLRLEVPPFLQHDSHILERL